MAASTDTASSSTTTLPTTLPPLRAPPAGGVLAGPAADLATMSLLDGDGLTEVEAEGEGQQAGQGRAGVCAVM